MVGSLEHRGPDGNRAELYANVKAQIGLGHARLSIIDLTSLGSQPMQYRHLKIVYNGEIYNYAQIKKQLGLKRHVFETGTDTEVILHAFDEWGVKGVEKFIGMFAFVLYDERNELLYAFRDRAGVKPFYFYHKEGLFLFASELKAFHEHPDFQKELDLGALEYYFDFGYIPAPYCIFQDAQKLMPGHYLMFDLNKDTFEEHCYWDAATFYQLPKFELDYETAKSELHNLLKSAFGYRMVADVPVGIFLSGGYDSAAVAAILQNDSTQRLKTFTIGFDQGNNEASDARQTADYLGTDHHEYTCTTQEAQDIIPDLPYYYDEPFADSSAIPTVLVSRFARQAVKVSLSADGGDELFGGYERYQTLAKYQAFLNQLPKGLKSHTSLLANLAATLVPNFLPKYKHHLQGFANSLHKDQNIQIARLYNWMQSMPNVYRNQLFAKTFQNYATEFSQYEVSEKEYALLHDFKNYLPDDILTKVDRATMSTSLEGRDPLLDHRILEFTARLPYAYKNGSLGGKHILKDIVHDYLPQSMMDRPKKGFRIPLSNWFREDLNPLLRDYLNRAKIEQAGILSSDFVLKRVKEFESGNLHYTPFIWKLLMFQMWYEQWFY